MDDVRKNGYRGQNGEIKMSLEQVLLCNEKTIFSCGEGSRITLNPDNSGQGTLFFYARGLTQSNPYVIIDFAQSDKETTTYKSHVAMANWKSFVGKAINRIEACGDCSKLK